MLTTLWEKISAEPQGFGEMIRIWLLVLMAFGMIALNDAQQSILLMAISITITFFTRKASTPNVVVETKKQVAFERGVAEGVAQVSSGTGMGVPGGGGRG